MLTKNSDFHVGFVQNPTEHNSEILNIFNELKDDDWLKRSHFFGGRYENLYLERTRIPAIGEILRQAENFAASLLQRPVTTLRSGFWINDMGPGQATSEHDHDDYDELLSGVYYVKVPENSGELEIIDQHSHSIITPKEGMIVFFAPNVLHSVSTNLSNERRISIGLNFGPV